MLADMNGDGVEDLVMPAHVAIPWQTRLSMSLRWSIRTTLFMATAIRTSPAVSSLRTQTEGLVVFGHSRPWLESWHAPKGEIRADQFGFQRDQREEDDAQEEKIMAIYTQELLPTSQSRLFFGMGRSIGMSRSDRA